MNKTVLVTFQIEEFQSFIVDCIKSNLANNTQKQQPNEQPENLIAVLKASHFVRLPFSLIDSESNKTGSTLIQRRNNLHFSNDALLKQLSYKNKKSSVEIDQETKLFLRKNVDHTCGIKKDYDVLIHDQGRYFKNNYSNKLFDLLYEEPLTRRMAATRLGFVDQTYMVTQLISDWIKEDKARVVGRMKCSRSNRIVEAVTTNPNFFKQNTLVQLKFDY
jgi:hypothetical protein